MPIFAEYFAGLDRMPRYLSDVVPWRMLAAPGVILLKQRNALMRTYRVRGQDLTGHSPEAQGVAMLHANNALKRLGGRWMLQSEAVRSPVLTYPRSRWAHPMAAIIDRDRERTMLYTPGSRQTHYYQTLTWQPPSSLGQTAGRLFLQGGPSTQRPAEDARASLQAFLTQSDYFMDMLRPVLARCQPCSTPELLTYLHACVADRWHPVGLPATGMDLDAQLCGSSPYVPGWYPQLGRWHLRTASIRAYPAMSMVGIMQSLEAKDVDFRLSTRWKGLEKNVQAGILRKTQGAWVQHERSIGARLSENITGEPTRILNSDATRKAEEADAARQELGADIVAYGDFTSTVTVWDIDAQRADEKLLDVCQTFEQQGFTMAMETVEAQPAWLSSLPGNTLDNIPRQRPQHSLTLAHLCPGLAAAWEGPERETFLHGPPWYWAHTETSSAFRVVGYARDVGHHAYIGPTGCHAPGTKILMYDGRLKNVEDIVVGDQVMGPDSKPRNVLELHQGIDDLVKIVPRKGESFIVNMDHVLSLQRTNAGIYAPQSGGHIYRRKNGTVINITVREWLQQSDTFRHLHKLYRRGVEFPAQTAGAVDPYLLGVLLGDGALTNEARITNPDGEIRQALERILSQTDLAISAHVPNSSGCPQYGIIRKPGIKTNALLDELTHLGLRSAVSETKFVPLCYQTGSRNTRLQVLAGLLDTDGHYNKSGCFDYVSKSSQLAADVVFMARSVGLAATMTPCMKYCQTGGGGQYFRVTLSGPLDMIPCQVQRKQAGERQQKKDVRVTGFAVEPVGAGAYYGFTCDGDQLYLMGDFTVTHNSGKSTALGFGLAQWYKHEYAHDPAGPQAVLFDVDKTARLITLLLGGQWLDVGSGRVQLQPLRHIDDPYERGWAHQWLLNIVEAAGVPLTGIVQEYLARRLEDLAQRPPAQRTLHALLQGCEDHTRRVEARISAGRRDANGQAQQDPYLRERIERQRDVQRALRPLTREGEYGFILDGDHDDLETTHLYTFEQSALLTYGRLVSPVIQYLFHFAERRFSTERPMKLLLEEAALVATKPLYKDKFDEWLMTVRKKGVGLGFVINSLKQTINLGLGSLITDANCPTRFYFPNKAATEPETAAIYEQFGLGQADRQLLSQAMPYRDVLYVCRELGKRLYHLRLSPFILDCVARNTAQDHAVMDAIVQREGVEGFAPAWLEQHGYNEEAAVCRSGLNQSCLP